MKILVLDDERWRHDEFDKALEGHEVHHAYTVKQFRSKLATKRWDLISFDHDLGTKADGADAARLLVDDLVLDPGLCVIHSWNRAGAARIYGILSDAGPRTCVQPFGTTLLEQTLPALGFVRIRDGRAAS